MTIKDKLRRALGLPTTLELAEQLRQELRSAAERTRHDTRSFHYATKQLKDATTAALKLEVGRG